MWETVSGKVELGEDPLDAIRREIFEEAGIFVEIDPVPVETFQTTRNGDPMILIFYKAVYLGGEIRLSHEHKAYEWMSVGYFKQITCYEKMATFINKRLDQWIPTM